MLAHVQAEWPNEACGLLGGVGETVHKVYPGENVLHSPTEYEMNPEQQLAAMLEIEAAGGDLIGIFHSHPNGPPVPSPTDIARAYYPDAVYLIFAPDARGAWQGRGFRIEAGQVTEVPLRITE